MAVIDPDDIIGRTYLTPPADDGTRARIKVVEKLDALADEMKDVPAMQRFRVKDSSSVFVPEIRSTIFQLIFY